MREKPNKNGMINDYSQQTITLKIIIHLNCTLERNWARNEKTINHQRFSKSFKRKPLCINAENLGRLNFFYAVQSILAETTITGLFGPSTLEQSEYCTRTSVRPLRGYFVDWRNYGPKIVSARLCSETGRW